MDYQSKYLKYKNKYLELKKIMNQNQIGGGNFLGFPVNKEEPLRLDAPRQTEEQSKQQQFFPPENPRPDPLDLTQQGEVDRKKKLNAPRQTLEESGKQKFFPPQKPRPDPLNLTQTQQGDVHGQELYAPRPNDEEQVFFPNTKKPVSQRPAPLDLAQTQQGDVREQESYASRQSAPRPEDDKQVFFNHENDEKDEKDEKDKSMIGSAFDFLMADRKSVV